MLIGEVNHFFEVDEGPHLQLKNLSTCQFIKGV